MKKRFFRALYFLGCAVRSLLREEDLPIEYAHLRLRIQKILEESFAESPSGKPLEEGDKTAFEAVTALHCQVAASKLINPSFLADLQRMQRFYGIYSVVARKCGVTPQHVRHTALGLSTSARVMVALEQEYRRIEQELQEQPDEQSGGGK